MCPYPFFEATPRAPLPYPLLKPGPVFVTSGGVIKALRTAPPEALAHSSSQMPLSCPIEPPSQCELCTKAVAAVVAWRGGRASPGSRRPGPAPRPVLRPPPRPAPRPSRARPSRVAQGQRGGRHACAGRGFRRWKMATDITTRTLTLPSSAAPEKSSATSFTTAQATSFACSSFTFCPSAAWRAARVCLA